MCLCCLQTCLENLFSCRLSSSVVSNLCSSIYQSISYEFLISGLAVRCLSLPLFLSLLLSTSLSLCLSVFRHQFDFLQFFQPQLKRTNRSSCGTGKRILNKISFCPRPFLKSSTDRLPERESEIVGTEMSWDRRTDRQNTPRQVDDDEFFRSQVASAALGFKPCCVLATFVIDTRCKSFSLPSSLTSPPPSSPLCGKPLGQQVE